jgi:hypothetical protein
MNNLQDRYKRYKEWKLQPHQVAPLSEEQHECATCGTHYEGNYCPRCGQSAKIGRYSFKNAFLLFLDVWGLGNRGMFRSIRDLILRPGYMIRDYLRGMQMAYFPPFKMFFLLLAIIPIKQLSGYSYFSTIWRLVAAFIPFVILCLLLAFAAIVIIAFSIDLK